MQTVTLKVVGRGLVAADVASLPVRVGLDLAVRALVRAATRWVPKVLRVPVDQVAQVVVDPRVLVRSQVRARQHRANLCREWVQSMRVIPIVSLVKDVHGDLVMQEVRVVLPVQADRGALPSKVLVAPANPVLAPSRGRVVAQVDLRPKGMIGSREALPRTSLVSVLPRHLAEIVKSFAETAG